MLQVVPLSVVPQIDVPVLITVLVVPRPTICCSTTRCPNEIGGTKKETSFSLKVVPLPVVPLPFALLPVAVLPHCKC